jgi:hypothetical protein
MDVAIYKCKIHNGKIEIISFEFVTYHRVCNKGDSKVPPEEQGLVTIAKHPRVVPIIISLTRGSC